MKHRVRRVAEFAQRYRDEVLIPGLPANPRQQLHADWLAALHFFFHRSFYGGRREDVSQVFEDRALAALRDLLGVEPKQASSRLSRLKRDGAVFLPRSRGDEETYADNRVLEALLAHKVNKLDDRLMVLSALHWAAQMPNHNVIKHSTSAIRQGQIAQLYADVNSLWNVGDKKASLFLRDLVDVFDLRVHVARADQRLLQPIDIWVQRVCQKLGIAGDDLKEAIVAKCHGHMVDPIKFNQGAWYVGFHAFEVVLDLL